MLDPSYYEELSAQMHKNAADQLSVWPLASANFRDMRLAQSKEIVIDGIPLKVMNLPKRAISTLAKTDAESLAARPCFLCAENRPAQQVVTPFEGAKNKRYNIQLNPYPILPEHFVIPSLEHTPQSIWHRYVDMLRLAKRRPGFTILYNGPKCGASAPDHFHFQAVPSELLPLENAVRAGLHMKALTNVSDAVLYEFGAYANGVFVISGKTSKSMNRMFYRLLDCCDILPGDTEPRFNLFTFRQDGGYCSVVVLRSVHRGFHFGHPDPALRLTMSPGCVDMGGIFVTVDPDDQRRLDAPLLRSLIDSVTVSPQMHDMIVRRLTRGQRKMEITILEAPYVDFEILTDGAGIRRASCHDGRIEYGGVLYDELFFDARNPSTMLSEASFAIGEEGTDRRFYAGALRVVAERGVLVLRNVIGLEDLVFSLLSFSGPELGFERLCDMAVSLRRELAGAFEIPSYKGLNSSFLPVIKQVIDTTWDRFAH